MPKTVHTRTRSLIVPALLLTFLIAPATARANPLLFEDFTDVGNLAGNGWVRTNNSTPGGSTGWFQGNTGVFPAEDGTDGYIAANFLNAGGGGDISNWLILPELTLNDGDTLSFLTRANGDFADRLEVRFGAGTGTNVGATAASVGDFTSLLLTINPTLGGDYPTDWTLFTATLSGLGGPSAGRLAFRYAVSDTNSNGDYIGIDNVTVNPVPEPASMTLLGIGLAGLGLKRFRQSRARA